MNTIAEKQNPNPLGLRLLPPKLNQIRGPRPPPLRVSKISHKIKKAPPNPSIHIQQKKNSSIYANQPTIIYSCSPRTIHARSASDFMSIVQRLTDSSLASYSGAGDPLPVAGLASMVKTSPSKRDRNSANSSTNTTTAMLEEEKVVLEILRQASTHPGKFSPATSALPPIPDGFFSPAARLAAIVKASPSKKDRDRPSSTNYTTTAMLEEEIEVAEILSQASNHPGILSPSPSTLPPIPDVFSLAVIEPQSYLLKHELSPICYNAFMASPSSLFSAPLISPSPSSMDLFNHFYDLNAKTEISKELLKNGDDPAEQQPSRSLFPEEKSEKQIVSEPHGMMFDVEEVKMNDSGEQNRSEIEEIGNVASHTRQPEVIQVEEMQPQALSTLKLQGVVFDVEAVKILKPSEQMEFQIEDDDMEPEASEQHGLFITQGSEKSEKQIVSEPRGMVFDVETVKRTDSAERNKSEIEEIGNVASHTRQPEVIQVEEMQPQVLSTLKPQGVVFDDEAVKILKPSGQMEFQIEDNDVEPEASEQHGLFITQGGLVFTKPTKDEDWKHAKEIYLMDNDLSVLPENPRCLNLSALFLPRNYKLRVIPPSFFDYMPTLQILNLSRTGIKSLPDSLFQLVSLERLFLNDCHRLMMLSPKVGDLEKLEVLDLEGAKIINLPKEIKKLTNLICLEVSFYGYTGNGRRSMQSNAVVPCGVICSLSQLEELNIDVNPDDERWDTRVEDIVSM
ncbi:uncharacterized protein LOC115959225 [Quercus lobata]|uniref:uncharacterized protein LOC115959225 n=1 Tax=Quercus lobata TaxID=97700 RepID=UPI001245EFB3|nr:uncharacterized protein LOC115959225 [Quercus lobata]